MVAHPGNGGSFSVIEETQKLTGRGCYLVRRPSFIPALPVVRQYHQRPNVEWKRGVRVRKYDRRLRRLVKKAHLVHYVRIETRKNNVPQVTGSNVMVEFNSLTLAVSHACATQIV